MVGEENKFSFSFIYLVLLFCLLCTRYAVRDIDTDKEKGPGRGPQRPLLLLLLLKQDLPPTWRARRSPRARPGVLAFLRSAAPGRPIPALCLRSVGPEQTGSSPSAAQSSPAATHAAAAALLRSSLGSNTRSLGGFICITYISLFLFSPLCASLYATNPLPALPRPCCLSA